MSDRIGNYPIPKVCIYCGAAVIFTSNAVIYGREYGSGKCYKCTKCDAFVGVHANTNIPLGILANKELRELKKKCHALFDPVRKYAKKLPRGKVYSVLAEKLGIPANECHFGWFSKELLVKCISVMSEKEWYCIPKKS